MMTSALLARVISMLIVRGIAIATSRWHVGFDALGESLVCLVSQQCDESADGKRIEDDGRKMEKDEDSVEED